MVSTSKNQSDKGFYNLQNRKIHKARAQLGMSLDECRELAKEISGKASISSLNLVERWKLIERLKAEGARVVNPSLSEDPITRTRQDGPQKHTHLAGHGGEACSANEGRPVEIQEEPGDVYPERLAYWNERFPSPRPGYASNEQLAWIETLWELDFNDGRKGRGLRGFIFRQTKTLPDGPVSDLAFLKDCHVKAVLMPLKKKGPKA